MMGIHHPGKPPFAVSLDQSPETFEPLLRHRHKRDKSEIPGHSSGIGHCIKPEGIFLRTFRLACKVFPGTRERDGVIRLNRDMIFHDEFGTGENIDREKTVSLAKLLFKAKKEMDSHGFSQLIKIMKELDEVDI